VHAVATDEMQVRVTRFQFLADRRDVPRIVVVVNRIRFFLTNDTAIDEIAFRGQTDLISSRFASSIKSLSLESQRPSCSKQKYSRP